MTISLSAIEADAKKRGGTKKSATHVKRRD